MFTKWQQVEDWITDNRFKRWIFYKSNPDSKADGERGNDKIVDSKFYNDDAQDEKLRLTKKYLEQWGGRAYGVAFQGETATTGGAQCVVCLDEVVAAPVQVSGAGVSGADIDQIKAQVREQVRTEFERQAYERERKEFEQERKEFERDKNSAIGLMVGYLKPVFNALTQKRVAGIDAEDDVQAARIRPIDQQPEQAQDEQEQAGVFSDDEVEKLNEIMARFKAVEPCYLELLEAVVVMAETGDNTYSMAKGMLLKK